MIWIVPILFLLFSSHLFGFIIYNRYRIRKTLDLINKLDLKQERKVEYNDLIGEYSGFLSFLAAKPQKALYPELYMDKNNEVFLLRSKKVLVYFGLVMLVSFISAIILDSIITPPLNQSHPSFPPLM